MMAATTVVYEGVTPDFTKRTPEESKLGCKCCTKLKLELNVVPSDMHWSTSSFIQTNTVIHRI